MVSNGLSVSNHWYLVSSHGSILFYIAVHPGCTIREVAEEMSLTQRTIWGLVGDLRRAGMIHIRREGRRHHYTVNLDAPFKHPILDGLTLRTVLGEIVEHYAQPSQNRETVEHSARPSQDRETVTA